MQEKLKFNVIELTDGRIIFNNSVQKLGEVPETLIFNTRKALADYINPQVTAPATSAEDSRSKSKVWINEIDRAYGDHPKMNINATNAMCGGQQFHMANLAAQQYTSPYSASNPKQYDCNNCKGIKNPDGSCGCKSNAEKIKNDMGQQCIDKAKTARLNGVVGGNKNVFVIEEQISGGYKLFHHRGNCGPYTARIFGFDKSAAQRICAELLSRLNLPDDCQNFYQPTLGKNTGDSQKTAQQSPVKPEIAAMAEFAVKCGYGGRFKEFTLALAGIGYLADECMKEQANLQDDSDIEQIARERKGGATVKVSLDDLQDDGK